MTKEAISKEIAQALMDLGYGTSEITVHIKGISPNRLRVEVDGDAIGIYDLDKHTFVD